MTWHWRRGWLNEEGHLVSRGLIDWERDGIIIRLAFICQMNCLNCTVSTQISSKNSAHSSVLPAGTSTANAVATGLSDRFLLRFFLGFSFHRIDFPHPVSETTRIESSISQSSFRLTSRISRVGPECFLIVFSAFS